MSSGESSSEKTTRIGAAPSLTDGKILSDATDAGLYETVMTSQDWQKLHRQQIDLGNDASFAELAAIFANARETMVAHGVPQDLFDRQHPLNISLLSWDFQSRFERPTFIGQGTASRAYLLKPKRGLAKAFGPFVLSWVHKTVLPAGEDISTFLAKTEKAREWVRTLYADRPAIIPWKKSTLMPIRDADGKPVIITIAEFIGNAEAPAEKPADFFVSIRDGSLFSLLDQDTNQEFKEDVRYFVTQTLAELNRSGLMLDINGVGNFLIHVKDGMPRLCLIDIDEISFIADTAHPQPPADISAHMLIDPEFTDEQLARIREKIALLETVAHHLKDNA